MSEKQIDALFRKIVQNDAEEESRKLVEQRQDFPGDAVPELSRARFEKMLDRELSDCPSKKEKERRFVLSKTAKRVIVAAAAFIFVTFGLMMSSEAVRGRITQFFVTLTHANAKVELDNTDELPPSEEVIYGLTYVPEGYVLISETHGFGQRLTYNKKSEEEWIDFYVEKAGAVSYIDTESAIKVEHITMHGEEAILFVYDDYAQITWSNEQYIFCIGGTLSEEEILKIATGVTVVDKYPTVDPENMEEVGGVEVDGFDFQPIIWEDCYDLGYLPDGFERTYARKEPTQLFQYQREHDFLDFFVQSNAEAGKPDIGNADRIEQITINGYAGLLIVRRDRITITWPNETDTFLVEGNISEEELLRVANSVFIGTVIEQP